LVLSGFFFSQKKTSTCIAGMGESSMLPLQGDSILITLLLILLLAGSSSGQNECSKLSCGFEEPLIRFPFQLLQGMKDACDSPGLCVYCSENNETMLVHPTVKLLVTYIDYRSQLIHLKDPENCLPKKFLNLNNFTIPPYELDSSDGFEEGYNNLNFFDCSLLRLPHLRNRDQLYSGSQDMIYCPTYVSDSYESILELDLTSCTKMFNIISQASASDLRRNQLNLRWSKPSCSECEAKGNRCKWKKNSKTDIECVDCSGKPRKIHIPRSVLFTAAGETRLYHITSLSFLFSFSL